MRSDYFYRAATLHPDTPFNVGYQLFNQRCKCDLSLYQVVRQAKIPLRTLDALECGMGDIDFADVVKLLEFYDIKLDMDASCFPGLPEEYCQKYFAENM